MSLPILYSFRRCPYAIRARMALHAAQQKVEHREIILRNKPQTMLDISPKGTVPVLQLTDGQVLDESLDVMRWALSANDPQQLLQESDESKALIEKNDNEFKHWLDRYKYFERHPEQSQRYYREKAELFLTTLEQRLSQSNYLFGNKTTITDIAIMPFVRQFAFADRDWFFSADYPHLQRWLNTWLASEWFEAVMAKHPLWQE